MRRTCSDSEAHLHHHLAEFDFQCNNRSKLGVEENARAAMALKGMEGKRLTRFDSPAFFSLATLG